MVIRNSTILCYIAIWFAVIDWSYSSKDPMISCGSKAIDGVSMFVASWKDEILTLDAVSEHCQNLGSRIVKIRSDQINEWAKAVGSWMVGCCEKTCTFFFEVEDSGPHRYLYEGRKFSIEAKWDAEKSGSSNLVSVVCERMSRWVAFDAADVSVQLTDVPSIEMPSTPPMIETSTNESSSSAPPPPQSSEMPTTESSGTPTTESPTTESPTMPESTTHSSEAPTTAPTTMISSEETTSTTMSTSIAGTTAIETSGSSSTQSSIASASPSMRSTKKTMLTVRSSLVSSRSTSSSKTPTVPDSRPGAKVDDVTTTPSKSWPPIAKFSIVLIVYCILHLIFLGVYVWWRVSSDKRKGMVSQGMDNGKKNAAAPVAFVKQQSGQVISQGKMQSSPKSFRHVTGSVSGSGSSSSGSNSGLKSKSV